MAERLNCIQNQITTHNRIFILVGAGIVFPPFRSLRTRAAGMRKNGKPVRQVKGSGALRDAASELTDRALRFWDVLDHHGAVMEQPMEKGGRKGQQLGRPAHAHRQSV